MSFRPLKDYVLVKRLSKETMSAGGIVIPDSATEPEARGVVKAVGKGRILDDGTVVPPAVEVGDEVLFTRFGGATVKIRNEELLILGDGDILGVFDQ